MMKAVHDDDDDDVPAWRKVAMTAATNGSNPQAYDYVRDGKGQLKISHETFTRPWLEFISKSIPWSSIVSSVLDLNM